MGTSALLAELYFTFFILGKGLAFEFAECSSVLVSGCEHFAWWVRGMCKRAWYGEEMYGEERRRLILDDMWRSREELNIFFALTFYFFSFVLLFHAAPVLCTARCALHLHSVKYCARHQDGANPVGTTKSVCTIFVCPCSVPCACVSLSFWGLP